MNDGIYVKVKRYATSEGTPENHYEDDGYADWIFKKKDRYKVYEKIMEITGNDHEISMDASSWCEFAEIGDVYEFREGEAEIVYID